MFVRRSSQRAQLPVPVPQSPPADPAVAPHAGPAAGRTVLAVLLLFVVTLVPYARVATHQFVRYDDYDYVVDNPHVRAGLSREGVRWAFTTFDLANWHPLTWLSLMTDAELFGVRPAGFHLMNVALHALNALLLFWALALLTRSRGASLLVAALFAVHPLRVESVAWAAERKDLLAGSFWMLALLAYALYARRPGPGRYLAVFGSMALGLMAKPTLVTLPFVLLLLDAWPLHRLERPAPEAPRPWARLVAEKIPLFALAAASCVITVVAQRSGGAVESLERLSVGSRIANALAAYVAYLGKSVWPVGLACYYPHPAIVSPDPLRSLFLPAVAAGVLLLGITFVVWRSAARRLYLAVGWLWYLGTLIPVIGLVQVGNQAMADRYAYVPLIGIYLMVVWWLREWTARRPAWRRAAVAASTVVVLVLAGLTWVQAGYWRDTDSLFRHALAVTRNNDVAYTKLGDVREREGDHRGAVAYYREALRIDPDLPQAHLNLGIALLNLGDRLGAEAQERQVLRLGREIDKAHYNLAMALEAQGRLGEATAEYEEALRANPGLAEAHARLGDLWLRRGRPREAVSHYRRFLELRPGSPLVAYVLAWTLATTDDPAVRDGREAVHWARLSAEATGYADPAALDTLAAAHAEAGDYAEAVRWQTRALELAPPAHRDELQARLELYREGRPYHEAPAAKLPGPDGDGRDGATSR